MNPSTGEKLDGKSLIKLNFAKNSEGQYHCPVLYSMFTDNTHIVAIRTTGNVYTYEVDPHCNEWDYLMLGPNVCLAEC